MRKFKKIFSQSQTVQSYIIFVLASLFLLLNSCHKYPQDEFISLKRPEKRIIGGYKLTHYYINGDDSIGNARFSFYSSGSNVIFHHNISLKYKLDMGTYIGEVDGSVGFRNNKKSIYIPISNNILIYNNVNIFVKINTWDILKLSNDDLWLLSTINSKTYEIHFKKS